MPLQHFKRIAYTPPSPAQRRRGRRRRFVLPRLGRGSLKGVMGQLIGLGLMAAAGLSLVAALLFVWYGRNLPDPANLSRRVAAASTKVYDRTGEIVLYELHGDEKRTPVPLSSLPPSVMHATLVAEDRGFYQHSGFDLTGIARAFLRNLLRRGPLQGGSTITQQLVKNTIVGTEKTYGRKIREVILSYRIEQRFSKDQILEMYLNSSPYGGSAYGIESATNRYFGKPAKDLTLAESAVLAALLQAPSRLSPYGGNRDRLIERQHYILNEMAALGYASADDVATAKNQELAFVPLVNGITAPHFIFYIQAQLAERYGERYVETGGLKITTTLNATLQKIAEEEVRTGAERNAERYGGDNAALVALDPKTGQILAMVGSRDYFNEDIDGNVNVVLRPRQPGSSFKPIVYAAAFQRGFTPSTILYDVITTFAATPEPYRPLNYDGGERGPLTIRQALAGSLNIPAVKTIYLTGIGNVLDLADRLGYTTLGDRSRFGLALVLGGGEVRLLDHVAAFQAFARDGTYHTPTGILKVEDAEGNVLESYEEAGRQAMPTEVARQITDILTDNAARSYVFGPTSPLTFGGRPVGAKTGTTNDFRDGWTIGFTPSLVSGVWAGNNDNRAMTRGADGVNVAAPIWNAFMRRALDGTPVESFTPPAPSERRGNPALYGELATEVTVVIDRASGKIATDLTPLEYREEKTFPAVHSELHYINPSDPTGPPPERPENDPNYTAWEEAVRRWASEHGQEVGAVAPTEYDDVHTIENKPQLVITSPAPGQTVRGTVLTTTVVATAKRGIAGLAYFLDGASLGTATNAGTFSAPFPSGTTPGFHTLKIEAYDDVGNRQTVERTFNYIP